MTNSYRVFPPPVRPNLTSFGEFSSSQSSKIPYRMLDLPRHHWTATANPVGGFGGVDPPITLKAMPATAVGLLVPLAH